MAQITKEQLEGMVDELSISLRHAINDHFHRSLVTCIRCANFDKQAEVCQLNGQHPPARIIALGCECFEAEIPF